MNRNRPVKALSPTGALRLLRLALSLVGRFLLHCGQVLLNGKGFFPRVWSVLVGAFPPLLWTLCFKQAKHIPAHIRPPIHIDLLPRWNDLLLSPFGIILLTLSLIPLARYVYSYADTNKPEDSLLRGRAYALSILLFPTTLALAHHLGQLPVRDQLDLFAFGSYGALHFASPIVAGWWLWGFGAQGAACTFGWCLGIQNLCGLATHLVFPNAAPWFYDLYGADAAQPDYSYPGNPAGLIRVDQILGTHIYRKAFGASPVVFGAIPSLHAATSICVGLFVTRYSRGYRGLAFMWLYCTWMFWATIYLHHHFALDLLLGTFFSLTSFTLAERLRLRSLDLISVERGLTNGWERLRWGAVDGDWGGESVGMSRSSSASSLSGRRVDEMGRRGEYVGVPTEEKGKGEV